jgi:hypothetical protein
MRSLRVLVLAALLPIAAAGTAHAQSTRRPDLNLFARGLRDPQQSLSVSGNLGGTFYDSLRAPVFDPSGERIPDHGWGSFASASLKYNLRLANVTFDGSIGGLATYYPDLDKPLRTKALPGAGVGAGWAFDLSDKTQLTINSAMRYSPLFGESVLPGGFGGGGLGGPFQVIGDPNAPFLPHEASLVDGTYLTLSTGANLRHSVSRRVALSGSYQIRRDVTFGTGDAGQPSLWSQGAGAALHFNVTENLSVRGGYLFNESHYDELAEPLRTHSADFGVDYGRGLVLQLTRRTTLALSGGASAYADAGGGQRYRLIGNVHLNHDIGRTWSSSASYVRGLDAAQLVFREPLLTDTFTGRLDGLISRRVGFHAAASAQRGSVGFIGANNGYYRYHYDSQVRRPAGLPSDSASQGVQVYLSAWAPIFQRGGRANASR